jgi:hypothetical protein
LTRSFPKRSSHCRAASAALALLLLASLALAPGCSSNRGTSNFMKTVNGIDTGTPLDGVRKKLGQPDVKREGEAPVRPVPPVGSPEGVLVTLPRGAKYQQWIYHRGDSNYHVFSVPTADKPGHWEVLAVRSAPASKVY